MGVLRRLAERAVWPHARAKPLSHGWSVGTASLPRGISLASAGRQISVPEPDSSVRYSLELDVGVVVLGHRLIVRGISLTAERLFFEYAFVPGVTQAERDDVLLNMFYDADISPADWNSEDCWGPLDGGASTEGDVHYKRPPLEARHVNRIARLTVDLTTGEAQIEN